MADKKLQQTIPQRTFGAKLKYELSIFYYTVKTNVMNESELRSSFLLLILGMFLNNFVFVVVWIFFFKSFGTVNNWSANDVVGLQGFFALVYGCTLVFGGGLSKLSKMIDSGYLDRYILMPGSLYFKIITSHIRVSAIGDIIYGVVMILIYVAITDMNLVQSVLLFTLVIPATMVFASFYFITSLVNFFLPNSTEISDNLVEILFGPAMSPSGLLSPALRFIFTFIIPSLFVAGLPIEAVKSVDYPKIGLIWLFAMLWTLAGYKLFYIALKRYESSNLIGTRV